MNTVKQKNICYTCDAAGIKLRKTAGSTKTDYVGNFVYENDVLTYILTDYGRIITNYGSGFIREYNLTDHLGNVRVTFNENGIVEQEDSYYPFGMTMNGLNYLSGSKSYDKNKYLYNGKELQEDFGLDWYDYGARFYDPQIGRWHVPDALASDAPGWSPYRYGFNNPVTIIDTDGNFEEWVDPDGNVLTEEQRSNVKVYIFYQSGDSDVDGFREQALEQYEYFTEKYGEGSVALSTGDTEESFLQDWKDMSGDDIQEVWLDYHGDSQWIGLSKDGNLSSVGNKTAELKNDALDINKLPFPSGDISSANLQINTCHSNASTNNGTNVVNAYRNRFQSTNAGFKSITGASGPVSYPFGGASPFSYFSFSTYHKPALMNLIKEKYKGSSFQFMLQNGFDPR